MIERHSLGDSVKAVRVELSPADAQRVDVWRATLAAKTGRRVSRAEAVREIIRAMDQLGGMKQ